MVPLGDRFIIGRTFETAEYLMNWMHTADASRAELRELNQLNHARFDSRLREQFAHFREQMREDLAKFREDIHDDNAAFRKELRAENAAFRETTRQAHADLRLDLHTSIAQLDIKLERRFGDLITWSFVFWVSAVGAIAALAGVLK